MWWYSYFQTHQLRLAYSLWDDSNCWEGSGSDLAKKIPAWTPWMVETHQITQLKKAPQNPPRFTARQLKTACFFFFFLCWYFSSPKIWGSPDFCRFLSLFVGRRFGRDSTGAWTIVRFFQDDPWRWLSQSNLCGRIRPNDGRSQVLGTDVSSNRSCAMVETQVVTEKFATDVQKHKKNTIPHQKKKKMT